MNKFESIIQGKKVLVFGVGRQGGGQGDALWLTKHGAIVRLSDRDTSIVAEGQTQDQIDWADIIIKNPGVPDTHDLIIYAQSKHIPVYTSIALFVKYTSLQTIAVTGTRGKSTTVALIKALLDLAYPGQVIQGGNIAGTSGLALFDAQEGKKYAVLELSSFQLHNFHDLRVSPSVAVLTNLYPDHLNRYTSMAEYRIDKEAIAQYQTPSDFIIYNSDNPDTLAMAQISPAKPIPFSLSQVKGWHCKLQGEHNLANIAAMSAVAQALNINREFAVEVAETYAGLEFRLQTIAQIHGVTYINDTTSTTPTAAQFALRALTGPTIWIVGGDSKNLPYLDLIQEVAHNSYLKHIIILGSQNIPDFLSALHNVAGPKIIGQVESMRSAVALAQQYATAGDFILLSPGFASFDLFKNEFDRGRQFNQIVLKQQH